MWLDGWVADRPAVHRPPATGQHVKREGKLQAAGLPNTEHRAPTTASAARAPPAVNRKPLLRS